VLPEFVPARPWESLLHNQSALMIKMALMYRRRCKSLDSAVRQARQSRDMWKHRALIRQEETSEHHRELHRAA
jgi:hypothetical protein